MAIVERTVKGPANHIQRALLGAAGAAIVTGCTPFNERNTIGAGSTIEPIAGASPDIAVDKTDDPPSISRLERSNWPKSQFLVPVDGAGHQPTYRLDYREVLFTNRQKGLFPTPESAMDLDGKPGQEILGEEIAETGGQPLVALGNAIIVPGWMIVSPPGRLKRSPSWNYQRWPSDTWTSKDTITGVPQTTPVPQAPPAPPPPTTEPADPIPSEQVLPNVPPPSPPAKP